jgi:glycine betaine/choline ABC-type transport system substrate-binding protein
MQKEYWLMDGRAFDNVEKAVVYESIRGSEAAVIKASRTWGDLNKFEVAIVDPDRQEVCWHLYAGAKK